MCRTSIVLQLSAADHDDDGDDDVDGKRDDDDEDNDHHHHLGDDADIDECASCHTSTKEKSKTGNDIRKGGTCVLYFSFHPI